MQIRVFVRTKEKQFVLDNRTANGPPASLIIVRRLARYSWRVIQNRRLGQIVEGVEIPVLRIPLARTVNGIRAALRYQIKLAPGGVSIFSTELVCLKCELLNRIKNHGRIGTRLTKIIVVNSVNRKVIVSWTSATDCTAGASTASGLRGRIGSQYRQIQHAINRAAGDGNIQYCVGIEVIVKGGRSRFDLRRTCCYFDDFRS